MKHSQLRGLLFPVLAMIVALSVSACSSAEEPAAPQQPQPAAAAQPAAPAVVTSGQSPAAPQQPAQPAPAATAIPLDVQPPPAVAAVPARPPRALPTAVPVEEARYGGALRWIPQGSVASLDSHVTSAAVTLSYGYNMYDTLVSWDANGALQPQMLEDWSVEEDGTKFVFTLREGQKFHDGSELTSDDVIASLDRWRQKAAYGPFFNEVLEGFTKIDNTSLSAEFSEPVGIFLQGLGIPTVSYPIIMPSSVAATPVSDIVSDHTGSGPFQFVQWDLGDRIILEKFQDYVPRDEAPSFLAGGKVAYLDRLEMIEVPDQETRVAALVTGEVDFLDIMSLDFYDRLNDDPSVEVEIGKPGSQPIFYFNKSIPPFDMTPNGKLMRQAIQALTNAEEIMQGYGPSNLWATCPSMFSCGTFFANEVVPEKYSMNNVELAKQLLDQAGYDGEPLIILDPADFPTIHPIPIVLNEQLKRAGVNVDYRVVDWATEVQIVLSPRGSPASKEWHIAPTWMSSWAFLPLANGIISKDGIGFYESPAMQDLRARFARESDLNELKKIADEMQRVYFEEVPYVHLGNFFQLRAMNESLDGLIASPVGGFYAVGLYWEDAEKRDQ